MKWLLGFWVLCCGSWLQAETYQIDTSRQIHFPPYSWYDAEKESLDGYFFMVAEAVASELGFSVRSVDQNVSPIKISERVEQRLITGQSDFFLMSYRNTTNAGAIKIVKPAVSELETRVFVSRGSAVAFKQWSELEGLQGGGFRTSGFSGDADFDRYAEDALRITFYPTYRSLARALVAGEVDYIIAINSAIRMELYLLGQQDEFKAVGPGIARVPVNWLISAKSPMAEKLEPIESTLQRFERSGRLQLIMSNAMRKYLAYRREQVAGAAVEFH